MHAIGNPNLIDRSFADSPVARQTSGMVVWIVAAVAVVMVVVLWRLLRGLWKESHARVGALPPANVRRGWPVPGAIGDRVMWCPLLARKVMLAGTQLDEGDLGTVVGFSDDGRQPIISFDDMPNHSSVVDKWGAARVLPGEFAPARKRTAPPPRRPTRKSRKKRR